MLKVIVSEFVTLDGVMQAPGLPDEDRSGEFDYGGWQMPLLDDTARKAITSCRRPCRSLSPGTTPT